MILDVHVGTRTVATLYRERLRGSLPGGSAKERVEVSGPLPELLADGHRQAHEVRGDRFW